MFEKLIDLLYRIYSQIFYLLVYWKDSSKIDNMYGAFEKLSRKENKEWIVRYHSSDSNVCGETIAEIAFLMKTVNIDNGRLLLDGDSNRITSQLRNKLGLSGKLDILTAGLDGDFDYSWDFEKDPPNEIGKFNLIVSQAMIEHLLDPYKHVKDLANILNVGGFLILHSVMPGYTYHRYPIDAVRFYPDWFEMIAPKCGLIVLRKFKRNFHLFYLYKKI